jgi:DGQHR domain-containing protein
MPTYSYKCLKINQRTAEGSPAFLMFAAKAAEILKWAAIDRFDDKSQKGAQRIEKPYKIRAIKSYFAVNPCNTVPTAVVIGFRPGKTTVSQIAGTDDLFHLQFTAEEAEKITDNSIATVVDGQHRLSGMAAFDPNILVNVIGLLDVNDIETAFQFLVINNKAAKVSSDHLRALALHYQKEELATRLQKVRLDLDPNLRFVGFANQLEDSPFKGILKLPNNAEGSRWVAPAAIEDSINYMRSQKLPELVEDDDMVTELFFTMWASIKSKWPQLWNIESKLFEKVSVVCLSQFLINNLLRQFDWSGLDIFDPTEVQKEFDKMISVLCPDFWLPSTEWTAKGLDTQAGRKMLLEALEQMVRNARQQEPWYTEISMIKPSLSPGG